MGYLTDLSFAPTINTNSLFHIVNTGDTTQNPAGSSYKTPLGNILSLVSPLTITGGTYNPVTGVVTFYNNSGGTFDVSGFTTGFTDIQVTGFTYNGSNTFTISETDGTTHSATITTLTGVTFVNNTTGITANTLTLTTGYTYYGVSYSGNVDINLFSPIGKDGLTLTIKDEGGYAGSYRIRISGSTYNIDNYPYVDMNINNMSLNLIARNNKWWII